MKYIIEFILATIIIFFVWNILKRIFFSTFYNSVFPKQNSGTKTETEKEKLKSGNHGLNWDAETVDYEEVKEEKTK